MKPSKERTESSPRRRRRRSHPLPKWLKEQQDLDEIARRRCLLMLRVLSGEISVSEAIEQEQISRNFYYQMEERALNAMLRALSPGAGPEERSSAGAIQRAVELEARVKKLEQDKRRADRVNLLTRKLVTAGTLKIKPGRQRKNPTVQQIVRSKPPLTSKSAPISKNGPSGADTSTATT